MTNPSKTPQSIIRGTTARFEVAYLDQDGQPLVALDPSAYPKIMITSPGGEVMQQAVGTSLGTGRYYYNWIAPADLPLSASDWRIEWTFVTPNGRQLQKESTFGVGDVADGRDVNSGHTLIAANGQPERVFLKLTHPASEVSVTVTDRTGVSETYVPTMATDANGSVTYYADTTELWVGTYQVVWSVRDTAVSPKSTVVQQIRVPEPVFWQMQPSLRMMLDKVQAKDGSVLAYSDSDMYEYMNMGMSYVNSVMPITNWTLSQYPGAANMFLMAASAYWGLQAQYLAAADTAFQFSGQTVTLDVDRTQYYADALGRLKELLDGLKEFKNNLLRQGMVGILAVRPYTNSMNNMVFPVGSNTVSGNFGHALVPILGRLGLSRL